MLHKGSEKPLVGLVVIVVAVILLDCVRTIHEALPEPPVSGRTAANGCFYQILKDGVVVASAFSAQPESLSGILAAAGMSGRFPWADESRCIPCDRSITFDTGSRVVSTEKIPGPLLLAALRRIDVNHAEKADLVAVPGIGPRTAEKIVRQRGKVGGFSHLDDLRSVPGIGRKKLAAMAPYLEIGDREATDMPREVETP